MTNTNANEMDATEQRFAMIELDAWADADFGAEPVDRDTIDTEIPAEPIMMCGACARIGTNGHGPMAHSPNCTRTAPATVAPVTPSDDFEISWDVGPTPTLPEIAAPSAPAFVCCVHTGDVRAIGCAGFESDCVNRAGFLRDGRSLDSIIAAASPIGPIMNEIPAAAPAREYTSPEVRAEIRRRTGTPEPRRLSARESAERQAKAQREEAERAAQAALDGLIQLSLTGSGDYAHGAIVAWSPSGERAWADVAAAATLANVTAPKERSAKAVASKAVASLKSQGLKVDVLHRGTSWAVYRPATQVRLGGSVGEAVVHASLRGETLHLEGPAELCAIVRATWDAARGQSTLSSAEITAWLGEILSSWRAVSTCYGRWLPSAHVGKWLTLANALADAFGGEHPPMPRKPAGVMSYDDIRGEVSRGLMSEIEAMLSKIEIDRQAAQAKSKKGDLGATAAATALESIADARRKLDLYEPITGPLTEARATLATVQADLETLTDGTSQRAQMLELA